MSSPRTANRLARLLSMLPWVIRHPGTPVAEVCERFSYTESELLNDLNLVFVCGLPGYGPGELMDAFVDGDEVFVDAADYFSRPIRLTAAEALMLLAAGMAVVASGAAPPALSSAIEKLKTAVAPGEESVLVDLGREPELAPVLREAAAAGRVVEIVYTALATGETTVRKVEPWHVFSSLGNWYMSGYCRRASDERVFRLDRVRSATATDETFDATGIGGEASVRYSPSVDDVTARIRLSPAATWVAEYYPVATVGEDGSGTVVDFSASDPLVAARLLIRLGESAELVGGAEVAQATADLRKRILRRYR